MKTILCTLALLGLSANLATAQDSDEDQMLALTQSVLQGITGKAEPVAESEKKPDLSSLISQAMKEGQSDAYLEALIGEAVEEGTVKVPDAMVSTDGDVDTKTLLASLVQQSLSGSGADEAPAAEAGEASAEDAKPRHHTVASGDSLAAIALQYYDDASAYERIFAANRSTIARPNLIKVGQVILIP